MKAAKKPEEYYYLWFDAEYTTQDLECADILEIAVGATDINLRPFLTKDVFGLKITVNPTKDDPEHKLWDKLCVSDFVRKHQKELLDRSKKSEVGYKTAADKLNEYLNNIPVDDNFTPTFLFSGNSVHSDWYLAKKHLPQFAGNKRLGYRLFDVTAFKTEWQQYHNWPKAVDKEDRESIRRVLNH